MSDDRAPSIRALVWRYRLWWGLPLIALALLVLALWFLGGDGDTGFQYTVF